MTLPAITDAQRRARIGRRHHLAPGTAVDDVAVVADSLVGLHSSDPVAVYLSAAARLISPSIAAVDEALYGGRSVIRHHAMRRTLWVMTPETARAAHASSTAKVAISQRKRLVKMLATNPEVEDPERWLDRACELVLGFVHDHGETTTRAVGDAFPDLRVAIVPAGSPPGTSIAAHTRVLLQLGFEGALVRVRPAGTWINGQYRWRAMGDWSALGIAGGDPESSSERIVEMWLRAFGPGPVDDLKWWTGWTVATVRRALDAVGAVEVSLDDGTTGWSGPADLDPEPDPEPWVALLPGLDPTTMGWKARNWYLDPDHVAPLFDRNGNAGPTIWVDGRIVGGWVQRHDGTIALGLLTDPGREAFEAIETRAAALETLLGDTRFKVRFPAPQQKTLLA
ncbi:MAG: winged helix DNA-binding domain-containing protein [Actinomycetia bacterium]|nr:winged helix DNA-binding domain-containing protein [Actinomycetes bacterium]